MSFTEWFVGGVEAKTLPVRLYTRMHPTLGESACSGVMYSLCSGERVSDTVLEIAYVGQPLGAGNFALELSKIRLEDLEQHLANLVHGWPDAWAVERNTICVLDTDEGGMTIPSSHPSMQTHLARIHGMLLGQIKLGGDDDMSVYEAERRLYGLLRIQTNSWHKMVG